MCSSGMYQSMVDNFYCNETILSLIFCMRKTLNPGLWIYHFIIRLAVWLKIKYSSGQQCITFVHKISICYQSLGVQNERAMYPSFLEYLTHV